MRLFRALRVRNYRVMFLASFVANTGTWMNRVAQDWLVVELSDGSPYTIGLVTALQFLPLPLVGLFAGLIIDRVDKRIVLGVAVVVQLLVSAALAALVLTDTITLLWLGALVFIFGIATAFELPCRQSFISELVPQDLVPNAVSLNSLSFNIGRSIGPAVAGALIALVWASVGPLYVVYCVSTLATLAGLALLRPHEFVDRTLAPRGSRISQAIRRIRDSPELTFALTVILFAGLFCLNFQSLIAMLARRDLEIGSDIFGLLSSSFAAGAMCGAITAASLRRLQVRLLAISAIALGILVVAAALAPTPLVLGLILLPLGFCALLVMTSSNTTVQLSAPAGMRGRLMSVYVVVMFSGTPIGAPLIGAFGEMIGTRWAVAAAGALLILATSIAGMLCFRRLR